MCQNINLQITTGTNHFPLTNKDGAYYSLVKVFSPNKDYVEKDLSKGNWRPKRQLGVTMHFFRDN